MRRLLLILGMATALHAHHEPGVTIALLDEQIQRTPQVAELFYQRGVEFLAMNQLEKSRADFAAALALKNDYLPAKRCLAQIDFQSGKPAEALNTLRTALANVPKEHQFLLPACHQLEGAILLSLHQPDAALKALELALDTKFPELYTWQLRAEAQQALGKIDESIAGLKAAWEKSRAVILRNAWIDALLDAGKPDEALPVIEEELASNRFLSSWLIRRARANQVKDAAASAADLRAAIDELTPRLATDPPAISLLCDRGLAYALLGDFSAAEADRVRARSLGASPANLRLLNKTLLR